MDRLEHVCLSSRETSPCESQQDHMGSSRGIDRDHPRMAEEGLVCSTDATGMRDPIPSSNTDGSPVTEASREGHAVSSRPRSPQFDSPEIERQSLEGAGLPQAVIDTSLACLRKSSRVLYAKRWDKYSSFCLKQHQDPVSAPVSVVLDFLQGLSNSLSISAVRGYVTAISRMHHLVDQTPVSCLTLVKNWLHGIAAIKRVSRLIVLPWCLELVLSALKKPPFQPRDAHSKVDRKFLTLRTVFLIAITSGRRVSRLQNLCWAKPFTQLSSEKAVLIVNFSFFAKVASRWHVTQPLQLPSMGRELDPALRKLCIQESLKDYLELSRKFRIPNCQQLFVAYGKRSLGHPVTSTTISRWRRNTIAIAYLLHHLLVLEGIKGLSDMEGVCLHRGNGGCFSGCHLQSCNVVIPVHICEVLPAKCGTCRRR